MPMNFSKYVALTTAANMAIALLGMIAGVFLARILGVPGRGEFAAIVNWPALVTTLGTLGLTTAIGYYAGRRVNEGGRILTTGVLTLLAWSLPLCLISFIIMPVLLSMQPPSVVQAARTYLWIVPVQFIVLSTFGALQGLGQLVLWNGLRFIAPIAWLAVVLIGWGANTLTPISLAYSHLLITGGVAVVMLAIAGLRIHGPFRFEARRLSGMLGYGLPSIFASVPQLLNLRLDQLLMAALLPTRQLGLYAVAVTWSSALSPVLTSISQVAFPRMIALPDRQSQGEALQRMLRLSILIAALLVIGALLVTPWAIPLLFGADFSASVPAACLLMIAGGIAGVNVIAEEALRGMELPRWPLLAEFVGLGVTVVLLLLLLQRYLLIGASVASLASYSATLSVLLWLIGREFRLNPWRSLLPGWHDVRLLWRILLQFMPLSLFRR